MALEKERNFEEEDRPLNPETLRDLNRAHTQVTAGKGIPLEDVMRRNGNE